MQDILQHFHTPFQLVCLKNDDDKTEAFLWSMLTCSLAFFCMYRMSFTTTKTGFQLARLEDDNDEEEADKLCCFLSTSCLIIAGYATRLQHVLPAGAPGESPADSLHLGFHSISADH